MIAQVTRKRKLGQRKPEKELVQRVQPSGKEAALGPYKSVV